MPAGEELEEVALPDGNRSDTPMEDHTSNGPDPVPHREAVLGMHAEFIHGPVLTDTAAKCRGTAGSPSFAASHARAVRALVRVSRW